MKKFWFYLICCVALLIAAFTVPFYAFGDAYAQTCAMYNPAREELFHSNAYISSCMYTALGGSLYCAIKALENMFFGDK